MDLKKIKPGDIILGVAGLLLSLIAGAYDEKKRQQEIDEAVQKELDRRENKE